VMRAQNDSTGSRVSIASDFSLTDFEAYRRGDRYYVKIGAGEVSGLTLIRGRCFAEVKAQRSGESTVVSFRLLGRATAHVEQRSNRLDVVFTCANP
jgi:hypothetical protein